MSESSTPSSSSASQTETGLRQLAQALRQAGHLDPSTQKALASLLEELSTEFGATGLSSPNTAHLAQTVDEVARSLHEQKAPKSATSASDRLKDAAARAEVEAPVASGVVYRLIDLLQSMGI